MPPPPDADAVCGGCYLYERRGVCPAARDTYGLQNSIAAERRAERFRQAVAYDAQATVALAELVRRDAERGQGGGELGAGSPLALPAPADSQLVPDSRKEALRVYASRPARR